MGIWCAVSESEYALLGLTLRNLLEHDAVRTALVLHTGPRRPPDYGGLASRYSKVREVHRDFGEGYSRSLGQGGYDQLSARNHALDLIEDSGVEWLLQFDADDYYDPGLLSIVTRLDEGHDAVVCSCYTLTSETRHWHEPRLDKVVGGKLLLDPHTRVWRSSLQKRFELCPVASKQYENITRHCGVSFSGHPPWHFRTLEGQFHFHLHCLLGKRHTAARTVSRELPTPISPELQECLQELKRCAGPRVAGDG
ncbi:glycosyltransferase [Nonomuraea sp. NPDC047529]|uniref:glycosyltransferase n=1 Tax=Nonomuraea sp. NPDC047529 TaxID=3155623 RepID=UPI0033C29F61